MTCFSPHFLWKDLDPIDWKQHPAHIAGSAAKAVQKWMSNPVYAMSLRLEFNDKIRVDTMPNNNVNTSNRSSGVLEHPRDQYIPVNTGIIKHRSDLDCGLLGFWLNLVTLGRPWSINIPFAVALPVSAPLLQIGGNQYENDISDHNTKWIENISDDTLHSIVVSRIGSHGIQSVRKLQWPKTWVYAWIQVRILLPTYTQQAKILFGIF